MESQKDPIAVEGYRQRRGELDELLAKRRALDVERREIGQRLSKPANEPLTDEAVEDRRPLEERTAAIGATARSIDQRIRELVNQLSAYGTAPQSLQQLKSKEHHLRQSIKALDAEIRRLSTPAKGEVSKD